MPNVSKIPARRMPAARMPRQDIYSMLSGMAASCDRLAESRDTRVDADAAFAKGEALRQAVQVMREQGTEIARLEQVNKELRAELREAQAVNA